MTRILKPLYLAAFVGAASLSVGSARAEIIFADLGNNLEYFQSGPTTVTPYVGTTNDFLFGRVFYQNPGDFDGGYQTNPDGTVYGFNTSGLLDCCGHLGRSYQTGYLSPAAQQANFPIGTYTLTATNSAESSSNSVTIAYPGDIYTSDVPALTGASYNALQNADPNADMTLSFNSFTPNPAADFGQDFLTITDLNTAMTVLNDAGFSPDSTSVLLPAGTLKAGHHYSYELIFDDVIAGTSDIVDQDGNVIGSTPTYFRSDVRTFGDISAVPLPPALPMFGVALAGLFGIASRGRVFRQSRG